jgi:hypothetical protein
MTLDTSHATVARPGRLGQGTAIEQSRAVAEVQAAIVVAQQCPRDVQASIAQMRESCRMPALADRAFFRFPRGGSTVSGPSVYLARELARCWGNVQYGVSELRRDDEHGQSEMQAWAWDVQTNSRASTIFVVPHMRDKKGGPEKLVDMRDIYENNANAGARRVRECIFGILPPWFVEEAKELCSKTVKDGGGKPLAQRIADTITAFEAVGITTDQLERKIERPSSKWTEHDVAQFRVIYTSLSRGEVSKDDEFPPVRVTVDEITGQAGETPPPAEAPAGPADGSEQITSAQRTKLHATLKDLGVTKRDDKLGTLGLIVKRQLSSSDDLTSTEASDVIDVLSRCLDGDDPVRELDAVLAAAELDAGGETP